MDALVKTETSLAMHPAATHARLAGIEYKEMARPTDMNMRVSFSTRLRAHTFAQREVSYLFAYLRWHLTLEEIREHLLRAGTLTPIWIDLLFTTPVFRLFGPEHVGLSLHCRRRDEYLMPLIKMVCAWGLLIQFWWPVDEQELEIMYMVLGTAVPDHDTHSITRRMTDSFAVYRPDVRPEQEGDEGILSMNTFFRWHDAEDAVALMRANCPSWTPTDEEVITEGPACDVYLWVRDGDYLVRHLVSPASAHNVLLAYDFHHLRINLRRREIDVYGSWGLPPHSGPRRPAPPQGAVAGFASCDPDIVDADYGWDAEGDAMHEPLLLPRHPNCGQPQFGFTSEEWRSSIDHFKIHSRYHSHLVDCSRDFTCGYNYGNTIHWRGDMTNGPLQPYDLDRLLYIYGGSKTAPNGLMFGQDIALVAWLRDYTRYVKIHTSVANLPLVVHDWNFEFQLSQVGAGRLTCHMMKLTREFEDNLHDQFQEAAPSACLILKSAVSTMQVVRYLQDHPPVEGCNPVTGLAQHLLHNGVACQLAYVRDTSNNEPETPRQSTRHSLPFRIRDTWLGNTTAKDFRAWEYIVMEFFKMKRARAALMMGGLIWRITLEYGPAGLLESGAAGPSEDQKAWAAFAVDTNGARYVDDILSPEEQHLAHKKQIDELMNVIAEMSEEPNRKAVEVLSTRILKGFLVRVRIRRIIGKQFVQRPTSKSWTPEKPSTAPRVSRGPRRPQLIKGRQAKVDCYSIPDPIHKKFQEGWTSHIPLNYLTDKAVAEYGCNTSSLMTDMYAVDPTKGLIQAEKILPSAGELKLSFGKWYQAWKRLLQLIKVYFQADYPRWKKHFERICRTDGATSENWSLWLAYNAKVRRRCHLEGIDPGTFHRNIWRKIELAYIKAQVMASLQPFQTQNATRSAGTRVEQAPKASAGRAQPFVPKTIDSRCFVCGGKGHRVLSCRADSLVNGQLLVLIRGDNRTVRNVKGRQYCFFFNMAGGCSRKYAGYCLKGDHRCSLCGGVNPRAQLCAVVA
ncbi:hypothetical protein PUNSTDRAFT_136811 [Punctularia strigosozonata HHB-11173 SS5]|uniref:uncharacterized protein n=1 Tax=Punctularia strigosozonata (strain HHB-11173) TaxID=741275 RepID=UPI0004417375|nr:uncharacterized protein PUNSTDRAFT_136811 [Punctularia strigosozonata HHB-11173 SS5]EIN06013.1 hypothetical protein PUNSTDRAFT_136811 [Punctularia strigosozonata HHB-11173 SS5]